MTVLDEVRRLLDRAVDTYRDTAAESELLAARRRLDEPLRVAIAGKVKAGKSTLLNALVGEVLAPTDAGECTRIVTWYRDSHTARVTAELVDGSAPVQVPFRREDGAIEPDLGGRAAAAVARLVVDWPSERLREMTLIDTPGIASLSADVSARTIELLTPEDGGATPADAVVYLMKHFHAADARFLESFHEGSPASESTPVNAVAVLSRADEVGAGRLDAMASASAIAARYAADPRVRRLCQTVVPVAGLLAQSASTLRESEVAALRSLASLGDADLDALLASADRFASPSAAVDVDADVRRSLLLRFGVFGVRLATAMLRDGTVTSAQQLSVALVQASGLESLRAVLRDLFGERAELLKARSGLLAVDAVLGGRAPVPGTEELAAEVERIESSTHDFAEARMLQLLRSGAVALPASEGETAQRLLGGTGGGARARLGAPADASDDELRALATAALAHWRRRVENPLLGPDAVTACYVLVRTCEGLLARLR